MSSAAASASTLIYDAAIIGGGPAGLAAALGLARLQQRVVLFDSGIYRNRSASHMHNVLTNDGAPPLDFLASARAQIQAYKEPTTHFVHGHSVETIKKIKDGVFSIDDQYQAKRIVLATGVKDVPLPITGYAELWGRRIHHCVFCHGREYAGKRGAVIGLDVLAMGGQMFFHIDDQLSLLLDGQPAPESADDSPTYTVLECFKRRGGRVYPEKIARFEEKDENVLVHFDPASGAEPLVVAFLSHGPKAVPTNDLAEQLGCEYNGMGNLVVNMFQETTVPGVFAAGDASDMVKSVPFASASGAMAAGGLGHAAVRALLA